MKVINKVMMYELLRAGVFGNHMQMWRSPDEFEKSGFTGLAGIRCASDASGPVVSKIKPADVRREFECLVARGYDPVICETSPDDHIVMQGDVTWIRGSGDPLFCGKISVQKNMTIRESYQDAGTRDLVGREGSAIVRRTIGWSAWRELELLDACFPDHVIEFTYFDKNVGVENTRLVIWEVRLY